MAKVKMSTNNVNTTETLYNTQLFIIEGLNYYSIINKWKTIILKFLMNWVVLGQPEREHGCLGLSQPNVSSASEDTS